MKIAIPARNGYVDEHFGHCEYYTIYSITDNTIISDTEMFESPKGCGCRSDIAGILRDKGVKVMLAGNMGQGAVNRITTAGIEVYRGCSGQVKEIAASFLRNEISDSGVNCGHNRKSSKGHRCQHP